MAVAALSLLAGCSSTGPNPAPAAPASDAGARGAKDAPRRSDEVIGLKAPGPSRARTCARRPEALLRPGDWGSGVMRIAKDAPMTQYYEKEGRLYLAIVAGPGVPILRSDDDGVDRRSAPKERKIAEKKRRRPRGAGDHRDVEVRVRGRDAEDLEGDAPVRGDLGGPSALGHVAGELRRRRRPRDRAPADRRATGAADGKRRSGLPARPRRRGRAALEVRSISRWTTRRTSTRPTGPRRSRTWTGTASSTSSSAATAPVRRSRSTRADGKFPIETRGLPRQMSTRSIAVGDLNGDGKLDLLAISDDMEWSKAGGKPSFDKDSTVRARIRRPGAS